MIQLRKHYNRLLRSARLSHIPCPWSIEEFKEGVIKLTTALLTEDKDMWIHTTLFVVEGHWGKINFSNCTPDSIDGELLSEMNTLVNKFAANFKNEIEHWGER